MADILFLSSDLMFTSRVVGVAKERGLVVALVADQTALADKLTADCRLAIVDLSLEQLNLPAAVRAIKAAAPAAKVIAYGPHVDEAALADASEAGCDEVLTRGQFHRGLSEILGGAAGG